MTNSTLWIILAKVITAFILIASNMLLTKTLQIEVFGAFSLWLTYLNFTTLFLVFGLNTSHVYHFKKGADNSFLIINLYLLIATFIWLLSAISSLKVPLSQYYWLFCGAVALAGVSIINADSQAHGNFRSYAFQLVALSILTYGTVCISTVISGGVISVDTLVLLYSSSVVFYFVYISYKNKKISATFTNKKCQIVSFFTYGLKGFILNLMAQALYFIDMALVGLFAGDRYVALYAISGLIAKMMWLFIDSIGMVLFPQLINCSFETKLEKTYKAVIAALILCCVPALLFFLLDELIIKFAFGEEYLGSVNSALILILSSFPLVIYKLFSRLAASENVWKPAYNALAGGVVLNVALNIVLIPTVGIDGAAFASLLSYTFCGVYLYFYLVKKREVY